MPRTPATFPSPRRTPTIPRILAVVTVIIALVAVLGRALGPRGEGGDAAVSSLVVAPPDPPIPVRRDGAVRVDTFPAILSVVRAVEVEEGWVILDGRARKVHVVPDVRAREVRSFGRQGEGPGEMTFPRGVAVSGSRIGVVEARGDRVVRFGLDGSVVGPARLDGAGCGFGPARTILAAPGGGFLVLRNCTGMDGSTRALLLAVDSGGGVSRVHERRLQSLRHGEVDPFATPVAAVLDGAAYLGILSDGCLERVGGGEAGGAPSLCAPAAPAVPLPDSIRSELEAMSERMEEMGGRVEMPETLPPFMGIRTAAGELVLRVPLPGGREALDLVDGGGRRVRLDVESSRATFIGRRHFLLARDLVSGTELTWVPRH